MKTTIMACVASCALAVLASPAAAEQSSVAVPYGDLDLSDERGMATLEVRLDAAIRSVCGRRDHRSVLPRARVRKCKRALRRKAKKLVAEIATGRVLLASELNITFRG